MDGFIQLHRKMLNWEWYDDINTTRLFIHLLLKANWKDKHWRGILVKRGTFITSFDGLVEETSLSLQNIRTSIKKLKSTGELTYSSHGGYSLFKLTKYNDYQTTNIETNIPLTDEQQTTNIEVTTTNKDNNINKDNKNISKDIETLVSKGDIQINNMINIIKETIESNGMLYKPGKYERARVQNILTGKEFGKVCEKSNMSREDFVINIINLASKLQYSKSINNGTDLYNNYADVYNKALKLKNEILQPKRIIG